MLLSIGMMQNDIIEVPWVEWMMVLHRGCDTVQAYFINKAYIVAVVHSLHKSYIVYIHNVYYAMFIVIVSRV